MPITSSDSFESKLDHIIKASKTFNKLYPYVPFSIEYGGGNNPVIYITYTVSSWNESESIKTTKLCEEFGLKFKVLPVASQLAVTLTSK